MKILKNLLTKSELGFIGTVYGRTIISYEQHWFDSKICCRVVGMDGCSVNVGIHNGAIRLLEVMLGDVVQHAICGLHLMELVLWHILSKVDGVTKGPDSLSGPVGSTLHKDVWKEPVVLFVPISGKVEELPTEIVKDLSRDQNLVYRYSWAIQTGKLLYYIMTQFFLV